MSLDLRFIQNSPENISWPEFPKLRELCICEHEGFLPIISKSKDTLEQLILDKFPSVDPAHEVEMPKLTDLYITRVEPAFINKILRLNCKSLEFLYLNRITVSSLDYTTLRMNRMKNVTFFTCIGSGSSEEVSDKFTVMCPNAVIEVEKELKVRDVIKGRRIRKGFTKYIVRRSEVDYPLSKYKVSLLLLIIDDYNV